MKSKRFIACATGILFLTGELQIQAQKSQPDILKPAPVVEEPDIPKVATPEVAAPTPSIAAPAPIVETIATPKAATPEVKDQAPSVAAPSPSATTVEAPKTTTPAPSAGTVQVPKTATPAPSLDTALVPKAPSPSVEKAVAPEIAAPATQTPRTSIPADRDSPAPALSSPATALHAKPAPAKQPAGPSSSPRLTGAGSQAMLGNNKVTAVEGGAYIGSNEEIMDAIAGGTLTQAQKDRTRTTFNLPKDAKFETVEEAIMQHPQVVASMRETYDIPDDVPIKSAKDALEFTAEAGLTSGELDPAAWRAYGRGEGDAVIKGFIRDATGIPLKGSEGMSKEDLLGLGGGAQGLGVDEITEDFITDWNNTQNGNTSGNDLINKWAPGANWEGDPNSTDAASGETASGLRQTHTPGAGKASAPGVDNTSTVPDKPTTDSAAGSGSDPGSGSASEPESSPYPSPPSRSSDDQSDGAMYWVNTVAVGSDTPDDPTDDGFKQTMYFTDSNGNTTEKGSETFWPDGNGNLIGDATEDPSFIQGTSIPTGKGIVTPTDDGGYIVDPADDPDTEQLGNEGGRSGSGDPASGKPADDEPTDGNKPADDEPADDEPADDEPADDEPADDEPADDSGDSGSGTEESDSADAEGADSADAEGADSTDADDGGRPNPYQNEGSHEKVVGWEKSKTMDTAVGQPVDGDEQQPQAEQLAPIQGTDGATAGLAPAIQTTEEEPPDEERQTPVENPQGGIAQTTDDEGTDGVIVLSGPGNEGDPEGGDPAGGNN